MFDYLVFIGRFQPLHNGHRLVIENALRSANKVIILVGSANVARSPHNPFTYRERHNLIRDTFYDPFDAQKVIIRPINDYPYSDTAWVAQVQRTVRDAVLDDLNSGMSIRLHGTKDAKIGLTGFAKDKSSFYLKLFPEWESHNVVAEDPDLSATDIRNSYLSGYHSFVDQGWLMMVPDTTARFLKSFKDRSEYAALVHEHWYNSTYDPSIYPQQIVQCVDAVVVQSGHILLVERGKLPGKGLLALPGGHVENDERFIDGVVRELKEETHISDNRGEIPPAMLKSFITKTELFDNPTRSERARVVTHAYLFQLPQRTELFSVLGDDDAASARWYRLGDLSPDMFFEDHAAIISSMTGYMW